MTYCRGTKQVSVTKQTSLMSGEEPKSLVALGTSGFKYFVGLH